VCARCARGERSPQCETDIPNSSLETTHTVQARRCAAAMAMFAALPRGGRPGLPFIKVDAGNDPRPTSVGPIGEARNGLLALAGD
jgi:hypothetical protein